MSRIVSSIRLDEIVVEDRLRPVDAAAVELIAASMEQHGLRQRIVVRPHGEGRFRLVAGAHRLAAASLLGWPEIDADVRELDDLQARMVEIDENLARRELTVLERAKFLMERKRVYETLHPETAHGRAKKGPKVAGEEKSPDLATFGLPRFTEATREAVGLSERALQRLIQIGEGLPQGLVDQIVGTPVADNQSLLMLLISPKLTNSQRDDLARELVAGTPLLSAKIAAGLAEDHEIDPVAEQIAKATAWFAKWDHRSQAAFLDTCQKMRRKGAA